MITLIGLILMERQIVLISCCYWLITPCAEALRSLLFPFEYHYNFIPVLPESMSRFLEAPVPFIFGMHRSFHDELFLQNDVVSVDLDNHIITVSEDEGRRQRPIKSFDRNEEYFVGKVPKTLRNRLKQRLLKYVKLEPLNMMELAERDINVIRDCEDDTHFFDGEAVRTAFLMFFIEILRDYRSLVIL